MIKIKKNKIFLKRKNSIQEIFKMKKMFKIKIFKKRINQNKKRNNQNRN